MTYNLWVDYESEDGSSRDLITGAENYEVIAGPKDVWYLKVQTTTGLVLYPWNRVTKIKVDNVE